MGSPGYLQNFVFSDNMCNADGELRAVSPAELALLENMLACVSAQSR